MVINQTKMIWLKLELKHHYSKLCEIELEIYNLHLLITKGLNEFQFISWINFQNNVMHRCKDIFQKKRDSQNKKLFKLNQEQLKNRKSTLIGNNKPKPVDDLIVNLSTEVFSQQQLDVLNKGLNFTPKPLHLHIIETIVDLEI